jgi:hypothetical protein
MSAKKPKGRKPTGKRCTHGLPIAVDGSCCPDGPHPAAEPEAMNPSNPPRLRGMAEPDEDEPGEAWWQK